MERFEPAGDGGAAGPHHARGQSTKDVGELVPELWDLIKRYLRQEAVDPIKGVGRFVGFGVAGALLVGTGAVLLAVGGLRVLQDETDTTFTDHLSWVPYLIVFLGLVVGGALSVSAISSRQRRKP